MALFFTCFVLFYILHKVPILGEIMMLALIIISVYLIYVGVSGVSEIQSARALLNK